MTEENKSYVFAEDIKITLPLLNYWYIAHLKYFHMDGLASNAPTDSA